MLFSFTASKWLELLLSHSSDIYKKSFENPTNVKKSPWNSPIHHSDLGEYYVRLPAAEKFSARQLRFDLTLFVFSVSAINTAPFF